MARGGRVNVLVVYDQSEKSFRWSLSLVMLRFLFIGSGVVALLAIIAIFLMLRTTVQHRRLSELTADNKRLSAYVLEVDQLKEELALHRDFTRRLCELIGVPFPDSVFARSGSSGSMGTPQGLDLGQNRQGMMSLDSARLPTELSANAANRPAGVPMRGEPSRGFAPDLESPSLRHYGLDIAAREGLPVYATAGGVVEFAGWDEAMGNTIIIDHGNGYKTVYGHNSVLLCEANQQIKFAEMICLSGNSGRSSAPHLHYEIRYQSRPVDPLEFITPDSTGALARDSVSR